jgi:uncharacterized DUF497 family protein
LTSVNTSLTITWDDCKNRANRERHGLAFEDARVVFGGPTVTFVDDRRDYGETRYVTMGLLAGRTVVLVHAPRGDTTRIISMRKANEREKAVYHQRLAKG